MKKIYKLIKKSYWIPDYQAELIKKEAEKKKKSESEIVRNINNNYFNKK